MNPAETLANKLLHSAIETRATDIHFYPFTDHTDIYFRVQGKRIFKQSVLASHYQVLLTYFKFTSGMDIGEIRKPQNGTITIKMNTPYSLRLSTLPVNRMESLAIRILPQEESLSLDQLFLFPNQLKRLKQWVQYRSGIILFTGPTGSGKTTTLYALLQTILQEDSYQTITLEDPVEKDISNILQVQVNEKAGITYQAGLKAALRHDPDIIMVGEIRDEHTAKFAFEASLTGHLVLSTLHAKNASGTIHRLLELGITRTELQQSLIAIAALELLPVTQNLKPSRRAAILELLDGNILEETLKGADARYLPSFQSFNYLRKKAYAYGFVLEDVFDTH